MNHAISQMPVMVVNDRENDWDLHLPYVQHAYNSSVSEATGLGPNEVYRWADSHAFP